MGGTIIASGTLPCFEYVSIRHAEELLHRIKITGAIDLEKRLPLYHRTLDLNPSSNYFCILDNSGGHENKISYKDIQILDDILVAAGIRRFYGATITTDHAYANLVKLAKYNARISKLEGDLLATHDPAAAESFIMEKMTSVAA
jgi:hypothetical protein